MQEERRLLWYLKKIPLLEPLPAETLAQLLPYVEMNEIRRRQVVYIPGDPGQHVYFLNGGRIKISKVTRDGRELTLAYRVPGEIFGELCIGEGKPREEMAEAMENALVTQIDRQYFEKMAGVLKGSGMLKALGKSKADEIALEEVKRERAKGAR